MKRLLYILLIIVLNLSLVVGCIPPDEPLGPEVPAVGALKLSQEQMMVDAEGGEFSVDVFTEYSYETTTNVDWITTSGGSCSPDYCTLYFTVAKNNTSSEREGVITFFCDDYNLSATLTVVQEADSEQGSDTSIPNNQIWYTSSNGEIVTPYATDVFGTNIVSNTYENGKGVIAFDGNITSIGNYAFYYCSSLTSVAIPNSVASIGDYAFYGCTGKLIIDSKIVENNRSTWSSPTWLTNSTFTELVIGESIKKIGSTAFYGCKNLESLTIGNNVTEIGKDAFSECHNIETINLGTNLTNIGNYAFNKNFSLTSVTIPESVTSIGYEAFNECTSLAHVYCKPTTPPTGNSYMFDDNASGRKIYVPSASINAYKSAQYWNVYASYIVGYNF